MTNLPSPSVSGFLLKRLVVPPNQVPNSDWLFDQQQLIMLSYAGSNIVVFRSCFRGTPPFLVATLEIFPQLNSNEFSDCIPNIEWIWSHVFQLGDLQLLESTQFFTPDSGFPQIILLLGMLYCSIFQGLKGHRFLDTCSKFLVLVKFF